MKRGIPFIFIILLLISQAHAANLDFSVGVSSAPPDLSSSVKFSEPSGNKILDAEEKGSIILTVVNSGKGDAFDVVAHVSLSPDIKGISFDDKVSFGTIPAGGSVTRKIKLKASLGVPTSKVRLDIDIREAKGFDANPVRVAFGVKAFEPPKLVVADIGIDDQNGNSRVEPMENVTVRVRVQNVGYGDAKDVKVDIDNGRNVYIGGEGKAHFKLGTLRAGEFRDVEFMFYTNRRIKNNERIPLSVTMSEARGSYGKIKRLNLAMNSRQRNVRELVVKGSEASKQKITLATGLSVDVDKNLPQSRMRKKDAIAVVMGNSDYRRASDVDFAINDARAIKMYLVDVLGYSEGNVIFLTDATKGDFESLFGNRDNFRGKLFNMVKAGKSDIFIYYSGHGAPGLKDKKGYFVPVEADPQYIELSGYPLDVFYKNISKVPARSVTVVLDACFSGANIYKNISPIVLKIKNPVISMKNGVVLSSSRGSQVSGWYNEKKHGIFTYFFLKAIQDKNADFNKDNKLTFDEIYRFISDKTEGVPYYARRLHGVEQTPTIEGKYKGKVLVRY